MNVTIEAARPLIVCETYTDRHVYPLGYVRDDGATNIVAEVNSCGGTEEQCRARADLLAAAPELLETCRALAKMFLDGSHYETTNPYCRPQVKAAMQAIARATGFKGDWMDAV